MKKRIGSVLLALALCLSLLPATALAEDTGGTGTSVNVETVEEFKNALDNSDIKEIHIIADMTYNAPLVASKPVQVNEGVTLTLNNYKTTVSGTIINNGTIQVNSNKCIWTAMTSGTGKLIGGKDRFGNYSTYVDYGCVPEAMLEGSNCCINIVKDISQPVTATLPDTMQTGNTISVTFSNLIDGVDPTQVFTYVWKDGSSFTIYDGQATPTLTQSGVLKLSLTPKKPYVMCTSYGTEGSLGAQGTVTQKLLDTVYVNQSNGNNSNLGNTQTAPLKSIRDAMDKVSENGTIVLLSDYDSNILFDKSVTVKSADGKKATLTLSFAYPGYVSDGVTVTLENLNFSDSNFCRNTQGTGSLVFTNCTGSLSISSGDISNITMESSQLSGTIFASNLLTMKESTFSGKFNTKNFTANGDCTISCKKNAPSYISGTVTVPAGTPVKLVPFENAKAGDKLLEVPNSTAASSFALADASGEYGVVYSEQYNGKYLCLAQHIENVKIAVGNEPAINHVPGDSVYIRSESGSGASIASANWSKTTTGWSADEIPELTVTLKAYDSYFFDDIFSVADLQVYNWTDLSKAASFTDAEKNTDVTCVVKEGQGVSSDGKFFTFTVKYPKIERLEQNLRMDTTDRTASCKEVLQPRHVNNPQGTALSYESSNSEIASVDSKTGVITVNKPGTVTITIHAAQTDIYAAAQASYQLVISHKYAGDWKKDDTGYYKECACGHKSYATAVPVLGVTLDKQTMSLTVGSTGTLTATIDPTDAANQNLTWTSDNEAVVAVSDGVVSAVAAGTANITVTTADGGKTATCVVTVTRRSSSSSSNPTYPITTPSKTENGSVTVTPKSAKQGNTVTITVTPDAGYVLDKLTVTDKDGKELSLTKKSDTEYTFVMPAGKVEITPSFVKQAEEPRRVFVDVKTGDYFYDAVQWAVGKGITNGTSAETFSPEAPCTRAQIVTFLWRAAGSPVVNYAMDLSDVAGDAYYAEAVRWALSEGITTGTSADQFSPDATCTREQAVTFLYRAAGSPAVSGESAFEDVGADAYYARAVAWAAQNGVTNGISQTLFGTGSDCTRAQIVTFLYRAQQGK